MFYSVFYKQKNTKHQQQTDFINNLYKLLTTSGFALPSSVVTDIDIDIDVVVESSVGLTSVCKLSVGDCSEFDDRFKCECSQHLVDVHILAYFFKMAFSAAMTSS